MEDVDFRETYTLYLPRSAASAGTAPTAATSTIAVEVDAVLFPASIRNVLAMLVIAVLRFAFCLAHIIVLRNVAAVSCFIVLWLVTTVCPLIILRYLTTAALIAFVLFLLTTASSIILRFKTCHWTVTHTRSAAVGAARIYFTWVILTVAVCI